MSNKKTIGDLATTQLSEFTADDYVLYWDGATGTTRKCPVAHFASNAELVANLSYNSYYKGAFADAASPPVSGVVGQWHIRTDLDTIWVWSDADSAWAETGSSAPAIADAPDIPYVYTYGDDNGTQTGYGWMNADADDWNNLADGALQADSGSFRPVDATVKFATLKSVGDSVSIENINITNFGTYYYRHAYFYAQGGTTPTWSLHNYNDIGSGYSYYIEGTADDSEVFGHNCWVNPYFGTSSYASGMGAVINNYAPADKSDVTVSWEIVDIGNSGQVDPRLEFSVDGNVVSRSSRSLTGGFATNGLDLYILAKHAQLFPQPSGTAVNDPSPAPTAAPYPGPSLGTSFDGVDNRIVLPDLGGDATNYRCNDNSAFSVSCQMYCQGGQINHSIFTSPKLSFGSFNLGSTTGATWLYSDVTGLGISGSSPFYVPIPDSPVGHTRQSWTQTWTGAESGEAQSIRLSSTRSQYFGVRGTYDGATKTFTQDDSGPRCYISQRYYYTGSFWCIMQDVNGKWWRALFAQMDTLLGGGVAHYNQTLLGADNAVVNGVDLPVGYNTDSSWSLWLDGKWVYTSAVLNGNPVDDFSGPQYIGCRFLNDGSLDYTHGDSMVDWSLTSALEADQVSSLHAAHNAISTMDWATAEADAGRPVTVKLFYPLADVLSSGSLGDVEDYSGNNFDATSEGF